MSDVCPAPTRCGPGQLRRCALGGHAACDHRGRCLLHRLRPGSALSGRALAALAVLAFFGLGQAVMVWVADADPQVVLLAVVGVVRVPSGTACARVDPAGDPSRLAAMDRVAIAVSAIVAVLGWLVAEIWTFSRLRIPVFDPPQDDAR